MKKIIGLVSVILALCMALSFAGCAKNTDAASSTPEKKESYTAVDMSVACLKGPTGVGMAKLMQDTNDKKAANNYSFTVANAADEISGKIVSGEINIASVPTNLAAKLYAKTEGKIKMLAVNTLGVLSILSADESVKTIADLKGKTVYSTGEGSNPEYILKYILNENGLEAGKDVTLKFLPTGEELTAAMVSGQASVAMIPEPAATTVLIQKNTVKRVISINDEWEKVSDSRLMMGCVVALDSYIEENKAAVDKFLEEYKASIKYATANIDDAAALCENYGIVPKAAVAKASIPFCNIDYIAGKTMKDDIKGYFEVLLSFDKTSIGGKLPEDGFYYDAK